MIYLREVKRADGNCEVFLSIFEGNLEKDKKYWEENQSVKGVRYFELKEVDINDNSIP